MEDRIKEVLASSSEELKRAKRNRDDYIRWAVREGMSRPDIASAVGLSLSSVNTIARGVSVRRINQEPDLMKALEESLSEIRAV